MPIKFVNLDIFQAKILSVWRNTTTIKKYLSWKSCTFQSRNTLTILFIFNTDCRAVLFNLIENSKALIKTVKLSNDFGISYAHHQYKITSNSLRIFFYIKLFFDRIIFC